MRHVAVAILLVALTTLPTAMPAEPIPDECATAATPGCHEVAPPEDVEDVPTYYLYLAGATCAPSFDAKCTGRPWQNDNRPPMGISGILYEETNGIDGLQRRPIVTTTRTIPADKPILL